MTLKAVKNEESETPWWHGFMCYNEQCDQGSTGILLNVRTDWEEPPEDVSCPICSEEMFHSSSWAAYTHNSTSDRPTSVEEIVEEIRAKESDEIQEILRQLNVASEWEQQGEDPIFLLRLMGRPNEYAAKVTARLSGDRMGSKSVSRITWNAYVGPDKFVGSSDDLEESMELAESTLAQSGFILLPWRDA